VADLFVTRPERINPMKKCSYCGAASPDDAVVCAADQTSLDNPSLPPGISWSDVFAWGGLAIGILGTGFAAFLSYPFFRLHQDIGNGAVLWFGLLCLTGLWTLLLGLPCAIFTLLRRRRILGWLSVIFVISPVPLGLGMLHFAMALNGFHIIS
jgi:hypothetical protein